MARRYLVHVGINYPARGRRTGEKRAEPGDVVVDLPAAVIPDLLEQGIISELGEAVSDGA